jgi:DNA (cytosine-5)-methyltransferase 1
MIRDQFTLDLSAELLVDNFAGGGGASTGIEMALGRHVDIADNHDPEAVLMHRLNHPQTRHFCEDVFKINPREVTEGRPVGLAWFSPDCKHFSKAKGGKPRSKKIRGLAWVVVKWAGMVKPRVIMLENVEEFQTWGPLLANNQPCPKRKGQTFKRFIQQLERLGYVIEWREMRACDYGAPTIRKRLFLIARCDGKPIVWPEQTHGAPTNPRVLSGELKPWRTAAECIDWSILCPSIFDRKKPLAEATMRRIARGIRKFVIDSPKPFIVKVNHTGSEGFRGQDLAEPLQTITGKHGYGIAVPHVTKFRTGATGSAMDEPLHTVTSGPSVNPAGAAHAMGLVSATVAPYFTECSNASKQRIFAPEEPLRTQCAEVKGGHFAQVSAFLAKHYGGNETPGSSLEKPVDTITATDHNALVTAQIVGCGGRAGQSRPRDVSEPCQTLTSKADACVVTSHIAKLYGTTTGQPVTEPMHTITGGGNHLAEVRAFLIKYYGEGGQDQSLHEPMHTIPTKDRIGLVTIEGEDYVITDIGMRMLEPHELYAAQGFPPNYIIAPVVNGKRLAKHAQVRMCGNSVCPPMAAALVSANLPDLRAWFKGEAAA